MIKQRAETRKRKAMAVQKEKEGDSGGTWKEKQEDDEG